MPKAARVTDRHKAVSSSAEYLALLEGHDDESASEQVMTGSHNVFINGKPAARIGDECEAGGTYIASGCSNVFINGRSAARVTDHTCHETTLVTGSPNVFIGASGLGRNRLGTGSNSSARALSTAE